MKTLLDRFQNTHEDFKVKIARIAIVSKTLTPLDVFALWRKYSVQCESSDQSALLGEFIQWYLADLGGNKTDLQAAIV